MIEALLLAAVALQLGLRMAGRPSIASRLLPLGEGAPFLVWAGRLWLSFALPALVALLLLGRVDALWRLPPEFAEATRLARSWGRFEAWPILTGLAIGSALAALFAWRRGRRGKRPRYIGKPARLPVRTGELPGAAVLAVSAGVAEELYFRLLLPLLIALVSGSALAGLAASALIFGIMHRYQGWVGVAATTFAGAFLSFVHLASGDLWLAMACHIVTDLNGLVIRPALAFPSRRAVASSPVDGGRMGDA